MHTFYLRLFAAIICVLALVFGIHFSQKAFHDIQGFKQLERIVPTGLLGVLPGENQVQGVAAKSSEQNYLLSPKAQKPTLYYRYMVERRERDSEGNTRWVVERDISRSVNFVLEDGAIQAQVYTANWTGTIKWLVAERYVRTEGSRRHTEWRIDPGDQLRMFTWAEVENSQAVDSLPAFSLRFDLQGNYQPIISTYNDAQIRSEMGSSALLKLWVGISLIALGLMCLIYTLQIHRILVYLSLLTGVTTSVLVLYGLVTLSTDIRTGASYLQTQAEHSRQALQSILDAHNLPWQGWESTHPEVLTQTRILPDWQQTRIQLIRANLAFIQAIYQQQTSHFPENLYARMIDLQQPFPGLVLSEAEQSTLAQNIQSFEATQVEALGWVWVGLGFLFFVISTYFGFRTIKVKRMIENIPTSLSAGVSVGVAEIKGRIRVREDASLKGPLTGQDCIWYRYLVEERRGSGKNAKWVKLSDEKTFQRFYCEDNAGKLLIDPYGAKIITRHKKKNSKGAMRYTEWLLKPNDKLYALGMARVDAERQDRLILGASTHAIENADLFILSNYSEQDLMIRKAAISMFSLCLAFSAMFASAIFLGGMSGQFSATDYLSSGLMAPVFLIFFMLVLHYNDMVFLQRRAKRNWANIQISLKKRADLLPQLQKVIQHYQLFEQSLLKSISEQRRQLPVSLESVAQAGQFIKNEQQLLNDIKLKVEAYPDLKANELLASLMTTLSNLENEIALMRNGFNDAVMHYNTRIQSFPDVLLAKGFKFERMAFLA